MMFGLGQTPPSVADVTMSPSTSPCDQTMEASGYLCNVDYEGNVTYQSTPAVQSATQTAAAAANAIPVPQAVPTSTLIIALAALWLVMSRHKSTAPGAYRGGGR